MKKISSDEIKKIELEILKEFDKLCKKNNLYYVMCGGTLLGAVRHKGFIPWDDDIDVLMPRPDYERLINGIDMDFSEMPSYLEMCNWKRNNSYAPFIKIVDNRTKVQAKYIDDENASRLWIDVFPMDGAPSDDLKLKKLFGKSLRVRKILRIKCARNGEGKTFIKRLIKPLVKILLKPISFKQLCNRLDAIAKTYDFDKTEKVAGVLWGYGPQERIDKEKFMTPIQMTFEGYVFNAPSNYDEYLSGLYKNYMELPPVDKRVTHDMEVYMTGNEVDL